MKAGEAELRSWLGIAEVAARKAASVVRADGSAATELELDRDRKIRADFVSEKTIAEQLQRSGPFSVFSEENGLIGTTHASGLQWIVDPLDGSVNYSQSIPFCGVSIALWRNRQPLLGVVFDFVHNELFSGIVGIGAWLNNVSIRVASPRRLRDAILLTGLPVAGDFSDRGLIETIQRFREYKKVRMLGSASMSLAYVAAGRAHAYYEKGIRLWDVAAGLAIVHAAGGLTEFYENQTPETWSVAAGCCPEVCPHVMASE